MRQDLELIIVVKHCLNLVEFVGGEFASMLADVDVADCHRIHDARAESYIVAAETWSTHLLRKLPTCRT